MPKFIYLGLGVSSIGPCMFRMALQAMYEDDVKSRVGASRGE